MRGTWIKPEEATKSGYHWLRESGFFGIVVRMPNGAFYNVGGGSLRFQDDAVVQYVRKPKDPFAAAKKGQ